MIKKLSVNEIRQVAGSSSISWEEYLKKANDPSSYIPKDFKDNFLCFQNAAMEALKEAEQKVKEGIKKTEEKLCNPSCNPS